MSGPVALCIVGAICFLGGVAATVRFLDSIAFGVAAMVVGAVLVIVGVCWDLNRADAECARRGGRMVPDGEPYYVMAGKVLVPVQPEKCEVSK